MQFPCTLQLDEFLDALEGISDALDDIENLQDDLDDAEMSVPLGCQGSIPSSDPECVGASESVSDAAARLASAEKFLEATKQLAGDALSDLIECAGKHLQDD